MNLEARLNTFESNGTRLLLSLPESDEFANASSILYFQVEDSCLFKKKAY